MYKRLNWILALILLLSLPALACSVFGGDEAEATVIPAASTSEESTEPAAVEESAPQVDTAEEETAAEPAPTDEPAIEEPASDSETVIEEGDAPALPASALELSTIDDLPFDSYRVTMLMEFTGVKADGEEVTQGISANFAFASDPPANSMSMAFTGIEEAMGADTIEMAQIEDTSYMVIPEMGCITTQGEDMFDSPFADMLDPYQFLNDLEDAKYEGEETVNNIRTLHYSFDKAIFLTAEMSGDDIKEAEGHVYIAKDGGFLVRMVVDATGKIDFFDEGVDQDGDLLIEINLTDVDEPVEIVIPADCEASAAGGGSEFPMLDDATEVASFAGVLSYQTALGTEETLAFYDDALAAEGWVKDEDGSFISGGTALVSYAREGETLTLSIGPDEASGGTYVVLLSETE